MSRTTVQNSQVEGVFTSNEAADFIPSDIMKDSQIYAAKGRESSPLINMFQIDNDFNWSRDYIVAALNSMRTQFDVIFTDVFEYKLFPDRKEITN